MKYKIVDLGWDYAGKIDDFAKARNFFLLDLPDDEYVLYLDSDVEASDLLLEHVRQLRPEYPWYDIRQINYLNGHYQQLGNPFFTGVLASNRVRWRSKNGVKEKLYPRNPHGRIDLPLIHNHVGPTTHWEVNPPRPILAAKKIYEIVRYGF